MACNAKIGVIKIVNIHEGSTTHKGGPQNTIGAPGDKTT